MADKKTEIRKVFESDRKSVRYAEEIMSLIRDSVPIDDTKFYNILIALTEALNNAVFHGNGCDKNLKVELSVVVESDSLEFNVKDQGKGFDPEALADPRAEENLLKERGRGVFLIKELSDYVNYEFDGSGTSVSARFKL